MMGVMVVMRFGSLVFCVLFLVVLIFRPHSDDDNDEHSDGDE